MNRPPRRFPRNVPRRHVQADVHLPPTGNAPAVREALPSAALDGSSATIVMSSVSRKSRLSQYATPRFATIP